MASVVTNPTKLAMFMGLVNKSIGCSSMLIGMVLMRPNLTPFSRDDGASEGCDYFKGTY
jgi:hypothetical protein